MIAVEAVVGVIDVHLDFRVLSLERLDALERNQVILFAEMRHHGHLGDAGGFALGCHTTAVIGHRRCQSLEGAGGAPGQQAAPAVAHDTDLADGAGVVNRRLHVLHHTGGG